MIFAIFALMMLGMIVSLWAKKAWLAALFVLMDCLLVAYVIANLDTFAT